MDPTSWSAYSQHFSRLGASMNHPPGSLPQSAQMNDLALSSSLPRQDHIPGYGNAGGPHHFLLAASHGLNPSQANHNDPSFNANLFAANYDASLFSASFPSSNKGHLSSFPQGAAGLFKAVNRENDFNDLRTGFSHCGMPAYARNSDGNSGLPSGSGLSSGHLFPNSMPPSSWRHSGIIPSSCGPFGVLPHETVLQRSHLVGRGSDKISVQASKQSRSSLQGTSFVEQDLGRGYRSILSSPARPPSSYVDSSNTSHSSLLSPQNDPYFSSVSDNYYSSCSKNDFAAYSSYCSNVQPGVQRSSITPYCYPQTFGSFEPNVEKQDVPSTSTNTSANANFSNFVPNSSLNGNPTHIHNGQISRQSVITSNVSNNPVMYNSESHQQPHSYNIRETYPYPPSSAHSNCPPAHTSSSSSGSSSGRQASAHSSSSHSSAVHSVYPPMSTPIPASTPAHTTPPTSIGQAHVPTPLPMSHDSGCSSVNSQSVMYRSPSNDGCYSTPGTCHSESDSPAKADMSQHSSPSVYSVESSNLSMNSGPFVDGHHARPHSNPGSNFDGNILINGEIPSETQDNPTGSPKLDDKDATPVNSSAGTTRQKNITAAHLSSMVPIDMVKLDKESSYSNSSAKANFESRRAKLNLLAQNLEKQLDPTASSRPDCTMRNGKNNVFVFPSDFPSALDFTPKGQLNCKRGHKRKCDSSENTMPLNCTYSHLQNSQNSSPSPETPTGSENKVSSPTNQDSDFESQPNDSNMPTETTPSPLPVDLSHVPLKLSTRKSESPEPKKEIKTDLSNLNFEAVETPEKWTLPKADASTDDSKCKDLENPSSPAVDQEPEKLNKCESPICRTPPMDDLSDESKKLCNSIEEDLGFLAGLSSDPDVEDSVSKGSFSEKKIKKEQGFLQSFLTFLESSNETSNVHSNPINLGTKSDKSGNTESTVKEDENEKKNTASPEVTHKVEKSNLVEEQDDKDNFDEAPSLDPSLFGCSTLQKEMVVPNPEAPSFSSDEDENSTQGIFDSVAMAIQRLCEDNEEDHNEKGSKSGSSSKSNCDEEISPLPNVNAVGGETLPETKEASKDEEVEQCTIKSACVVKTKRGKRRKARHLLVIKVKRAAEKTSDTKTSDVPKIASESPKQLRKKDEKVTKISQSTQRRTLMRKCKGKAQGLKKKKNSKVKRKPRNCMKRKHSEEEKEVTDAVIKEKEKDELPEPEEKVIIKESPEPKSPEAPVPVVQVVTPKKPKRLFYKGRRRRRSHKKVSATEKNPVESEPAKTNEEDAVPCTSETLDASASQKSSNVAENSTETHFKTGDYVRSIDNKDSEKPPIWRIEGKNVLQLFEAIEGDSSSILYRNTSSYSRWSPSSKHKYSKQPVKVIKSDDDTVIVELLTSTDNIDVKDNSSTCDYTVHPQRENFEVYLQTLVSHALDPDFIPEIIKENDEYFLSHLQVIEEITSSKKSSLLQCEKWSTQLFNSVRMYPYVSVSMSKEDEKKLCQVCNSSKVQFLVHFHGQIYDPMTLTSKAEGQSHPVCDFNFPLCGSCVQIVSLYNKLHHHKYHFFQMGCKKVKDVQKGIEKDSHLVLEECLQDMEWMTQMFKDMVEMWNACDKYR